MSKTEGEVEFRPRTAYSGLKTDCINRSADYDCPNAATQEAVYGRAHIRCCNDPKCMERAATIAKIQA